MFFEFRWFNWVGNDQEYISGVVCEWFFGIFV